MGSKEFKSFQEFYPFYLSEHSQGINRLLHFVGTSLVLLIFAAALLSQKWSLLWLCPLAGYGLAGVGHFLYEKNRPSTFKHPFYGLMADFVMWKDLLLGKIKF